MGVSSSHDPARAGAVLVPAAEPEFPGTSALIRAVSDRIARCATSRAPVVITGESGAGKERAARAIHRHSAQSTTPFVVVDCATLPAAIPGSGLFGIATPSNGDTRRTIEVAHTETLFFDNIVRMSLEVQRHLLHCLEEWRFRRLDGASPAAMDVRVIAATQLPLKSAVRQGGFFSDLYYHLNVLTIDMPPLRLRREDILPLASAVLQELEKSRQRGFTAAARAAMESHDWPGNVRELVAVLRRAIVFASGPAIDVADLGIDHRRAPADEFAASSGGGGTVATRCNGRADLERIRDALARNRFNIRRTAEELRLSRVTLYRLIDRHAIAIVRPPPRTGGGDVRASADRPSASSPLLDPLAGSPPGRRQVDERGREKAGSELDLAFAAMPPSRHGRARHP